MWNQSKYSNFNKDFQVTESFKMHQKQLKKIRSSSRVMIDNNSPVKPKFLDFPLKLREYNVIKQLDYVLENKKLFQKIEVINKKQSVDKICENIRKQENNLKSISNLTKRYHEIKIISEENDKLYQRIKQTQPVISAKEHNKQEMMNSCYKDLLKCNRRSKNPMLEMNQMQSTHRRTQSNRVIESNKIIETRAQMNTLLVKRSDDERLPATQRDIEFKMKLEQEYQKYQQKLNDIKEQQHQDKLQQEKQIVKDGKNKKVTKQQKDQKEQKEQKQQKEQKEQKQQKEQKEQTQKGEEQYMNEKFVGGQNKFSKVGMQQHSEGNVITENSVNRKEDAKIADFEKRGGDLEKQQFIDI